MALIKCKECGTEVSSKAETCPKCGARVARKPIGCGTAIIVIIFIGFIGSIFSSRSTSNKQAEPITTSTAPQVERSISMQPSQASETLPSQEPVVPSSKWVYSQKADAMSNGTSYNAYVLSTNTVNLDFPYNGEQNAQLFLRVDPRYGKNVIFSIEKGQILCSSYDGCNVLVRFDDEKASNFSATGAADNSTETIFISNYGRFVEKMLKAKRVRISISIYQGGEPIFEFDVSGFDQNKFKPRK